MPSLHSSFYKHAFFIKARLYGSQSHCERNLRRVVYQYKQIKSINAWDIGYLYPIFNKVNYIIETVKEGALPLQNVKQDNIRKEVRIVIHFGKYNYIGQVVSLGNYKLD